MEFRDKAVWITGASSGIGESLARAFARRGAKLILSARRETELARVKDEIAAMGIAADRIAVLPFDITDEASLDTVIDAAEAAFGQVDVLINNAGISQRSLALETEMAVYRRIMEVDFFAPVALTQKLLPRMVAQGGGHIAVTSSIAGKVGAQLRTAYCAAKHAVMGYFDALRAEVAQHNIGVTTIVPGFIRTNIARHALTGDATEKGEDSPSIAAGMDPDRAAAVILRGMERDQPEIPVGEGREMALLTLKRVAPRAVFRMVAKMQAE